MGVWRRRGATVVAGGLALGMAYGVMFGHNGLTAFARKRQEEQNLRMQMQQLQRDNARLQGHVERLQNDPGAIEHQAREELHYTRAGEVIYRRPFRPGLSPFLTSSHSRTILLSSRKTWRSIGGSMRIGVDLGGTKTEAIALDAQGMELRRVRTSTPHGDYKGTVTTITSLVTQLETEVGASATVGVGIPGTIVAATGLVKNANSTWLNNRPLQEDLSAALQREVRCANDANCFAISEATDGAAAGVGITFGVILGTGCGGGIAIQGRIHAGQNGIAGEWGHIPLPWPTVREIPGPACYCGRSGCMETWISGTGFERDYQRCAGNALSAREILALARSGDLAATSAVYRLKDRIARGLAVMADILDPDMVVLGGGLSNIEELYDGELEQSIAMYSFGGGTSTPIKRNLHGDSSGVRGAAWLWA